MSGYPDLTAIRSAHRLIAPYIHRTPVLTSENLDHLTGVSLFFKCENFQKAGAFKSRGATHAVFSASAGQLHNGVCTHSSGNHAAALSRAAALRDIPAYIVMPENSSRVKVEAVVHYGGIITFCRPTLVSREQTLEKVREKTGAIEIHPYNDPVIIAGQATAAKELIEDTDHLDVIIAPVGGGGLLSGTALSTHYLSPGTRVIAAEPAGASDAFRSFRDGTLHPSVEPETIADGLLTSLGSVTFPIIRDHVDAIVLASEGSIIRAMKLIWERMKIIVEPSAAVPFAAILEGLEELRGSRVGIILSGGNLDLDRLPWITGS
ncbi:MAG: pyridoxal-phosphate dependent enzyme [Bacteroidales bacterium]|nr:pyridoxal-phosphate dependent enzyme [Bacteroidales bacterium]